jgi:hypothetical protein
MATVTFNLTQTDATEIAKIIAAASSAESQLWLDRSRTIDQIKRLYAVVMGVALTTVITNCFLWDRAVPNAGWDTHAVFLAITVSFVSPMALYYLGGERMMDQKYLRPAADNPHPIVLWLDLAMLGLTAALFVVVANAIPPPPSPDQANPLSVKDAQRTILPFVHALAALYFIDASVLVVQAFAVSEEDEKLRSKLRKAYIVWAAINAFFFLTLWRLPELIDSWPPFLGIGALTVYIGLVALARFFVDYLVMFPFYYPLREGTALPTGWLSKKLRQLHS